MVIGVAHVGPAFAPGASEGVQVAGVGHMGDAGRWPCHTCRKSVSSKSSERARQASTDKLAPTCKVCVCGYVSN